MNYDWLPSENRVYYKQLKLDYCDAIGDIALLLNPVSKVNKK